MRKRDKASLLVPRLKPYSGVGENFLARNAGMIVSVSAVVACLPYGFSYAIFTPWLLVPLLVPIVILGVLIVWAIPDVMDPPEDILVKLFFAFLLAFLLWPNYISLEVTGLPWITITRLIGTPLALLLLICASSSPLFRQNMSKVLAESSLIWKFLTAYIVLQMLSLPFSKSLGDSIGEFVISQTTQTAIFFVCCYVFRNPGHAQKWMNILFVSCIIISIIAIFEFFNKKVLWAGIIPQFLQPRDEVISKILAGGVRRATGQYRAQSVFTTSLGLSEFCALVMPFLIHFASSNNYKVAIRVLAGVTALVSIYVILLTDSRLGLFGGFVAAMLYLLLWSIKSVKSGNRAIFPTSVLIAYPVIFVLLVSASLIVGRIRTKVWGAGQYNESNQGRSEQIAMGIPKVFEYPLGHGTGTGGTALGWTNAIGELSIDNYLLLVALDTGILGLITFLAFLLIAGVSGLKVFLTNDIKNREFDLLLPLSISIFVFVVVKTVFAQDDTHPIIYMILGILAATIYRVKSGDLKPKLPTSAGSRPGR